MKTRTEPGGAAGLHFLACGHRRRGRDCLHRCRVPTPACGRASATNRRCPCDRSAGDLRHALATCCPLAIGQRGRADCRSSGFAPPSHPHTRQLHRSYGDCPAGGSQGGQDRSGAGRPRTAGPGLLACVSGAPSPRRFSLSRVLRARASGTQNENPRRSRGSHCLNSTAKPPYRRIVNVMPAKSSVSCSVLLRSLNSISRRI